MDADALAALDADGYTVLEAVSYDRPPPRPSHATPHAFVCVDGNTYWVKRGAQQGLMAELLAGRLGKASGSAPPAQIVRVVPETMATIPNPPTQLVGVGAGILDEPKMENASDRKDWTPIERDAGHFLFGIEHLEVDGRAVIQPPPNGSPPDAYARIQGWLESATCRSSRPTSLRMLSRRLNSNRRALNHSIDAWLTRLGSVR